MWTLWIKGQRVSNILLICDAKPDAADDYISDYLLVRAIVFKSLKV